MATRLSAGGDAAQAGVAHGQAGDAGGAVGHGAVAATGEPELVAVVDHLLEGERRADDAAVELGDGDADGHVEGRRGPASSPAQSSRRPVARRRLEDRHVEGGERGTSQSSPSTSDVPAGPPHGQHGGDQHVDAVVAQQLERRDPTVGVGPQRVAPHRQRVGAGGLDGVAQVGRRTACSRRPGGPGRRRRRPAAARGRVGARQAQAGAVRHLGERQRTGRVEAEALEQHRVGDEPQQVREVGAARRARGRRTPR